MEGGREVRREGEGEGEGEREGKKMEEQLNTGETDETGSMKSIVP